MARLPRLTVAGYPHHIIQRGNNRQDIVRSDADREFLLDLLGESARKHQVAMNAYVLMDNHFHLLLTPETAEGVPLMMQAVGRRYVRHFNDRYQRTGTLWEGRYRSTLIQTERYLLACMVYMDLNPVRAGMVADPKNHPWSSHRHHIGASRHTRSTGVWATRRSPARRRTPKWCAPVCRRSSRAPSPTRRCTAGRWATRRLRRSCKSARSAGSRAPDRAALCLHPAIRLDAHPSWVFRQRSIDLSPIKSMIKSSA